MTEPVVVAYGGGVNSTALLVGLRDRGRRPDLILFADTGGEKPETYAFLEVMNAWLIAVGFPPVVAVANDGAYSTLEAECLANHTLPSLAFGRRSCSDKYKRRPQDKYVTGWEPARRAWAIGMRVVKLLGIDAGESHRAVAADDPRFRTQFPLVEWDWGRDECLAAIRQARIPVPPKSACFFCPASTKREVLALAEAHPALFDRAVAMERNAAPRLTAVRGLGRRYAWSELAAGGRAALPLLPETPISPPCLCFDGDSSSTSEEEA